MNHVHIAHDCQVGNQTIIAGYSGLAGHVQLGDWAIVGGQSGLHQFVRVGAHAMIGFQSHVSQDVPPFMMVDGHPLAVRGFNVEGMRRRGFSAERIAAVKQMHRLLYRDGLTFDDARAGSTRSPRRRRKRPTTSAWSAISSPRPSAASLAERSIRRMDPDAPRFAMVAGEASGDLLAGSLLASLRARWPTLVAEGIGGPRMAAQGFVAWWPHDKLSVRGYFEVLGHFREILAIRNRLVERLLADKPDAFIGVDAPDFNLGVETRLKAAGVQDDPLRQPVDLGLARRPDRGHRPRHRPRALHLSVRARAIYARRGINAVYVGHPLASAIPFEVPRAARAAPRSASAPTRPWWRCCRAAAARRSATSRRACSAPRSR